MTVRWILIPLLFSGIAGAAGLGFQTHYLSSNSSDQSIAVAADSSGNVFVISSVAVSPSEYRLRAIKTDSQGNVSASFDFGSNGGTGDSPSAAAVNSQGQFIIVGTTYSSSFPVTVPPVRPIAFSGNNAAAFVAILDPSLTHIVASTMLGGSRNKINYGRTQGEGVAVDRSGNVYVSGSTSAMDFPVTQGAYLTNPPWGNNLGSPTYAFVAKLSPDLKQILYATFFGGDASACIGGSACIGRFGETSAVSIAVDGAGEAVIAGETNALNLPVTPGAYATQCGCGKVNSSGFVAKFSAGGAALLWSTYLPTMPFSDSVRIAAIAIDTTGNVVAAGQAPSGFATTSGTVQPSDPLDPITHPSASGFVAEFDNTGRHLIFSTYFGAFLYGGGVKALAIDSANHIWLTGISDPAKLPIPTPIGSDYIGELSADGSSVLQLYGAPTGSAGQSLALLPSGGLAVLGTESSLLLSSPNSGPSILGVANAAATRVSAAISPGEIVSLYGYNLGPSAPLTAQVANGKVMSSLAGYQVQFNGIAAPLLYVVASQINAVVPQEIEGRNTVSVKMIAPVGSTTTELFTATSQPEIFADFATGYAFALNQDQTVNSAQNPAAAGSVVTIWATGEGTHSQGYEDGDIVSNSALSKPSLPISVLYANFLYESSLEVLYAGDAPGDVFGVLQINFRLPAQIDSFTKMISVRLEAGSAISDGVGIYVKP